MLGESSFRLDGPLIAFERDALHRETLRTQGKLTSRFGCDAQGRKAWQAAIALPHEQLSQFTREAGSLFGHPSLDPQRHRKI